MEQNQAKEGAERFPIGQEALAIQRVRPGQTGAAESQNAEFEITEASKDVKAEVLWVLLGLVKLKLRFEVARAHLFEEHGSKKATCKIDKRGHEDRILVLV